MPKKVLIIEDSPTDANIVKEMLEKEAIEVSIASTGEEGFEMALRLSPDLVVLDLMLPDTNGYEICTRIRAEGKLKGAMIVILSSKDEIADITKAFKAGADDYIIKPPIPDFLTRKVKLYLGMR